ncbi:hypothetical protein DFP73DRAFT_581077 [Morchella snyderi]|nr:hypothetical protein DFP73DRAFT_581077 [Morchella snyderi]
MSSEIRVCVFCASRPGTNPKFTAAAESLAEELYQQSWSLVYGGGNRGLMGSVAKTLFDKGGKVHGIIPRALIRREVEGEMDIGTVAVVESMHERKNEMAKVSDAFVALPGGFGTLDELVEIITWSQIGIHAKPIVLFNVDGFFDNFLKMMEDFYSNGFVEEETRGILRVATTSAEVISAIESYVPPDGRMKLAWDKKPNT